MSDFLLSESQIPLLYLVADRFEAGSKLVADLQRAQIWPISLLAANYHELAGPRPKTSFELVCDQIEKSWTKRGVNKLFKKLRDTGTVNRQPGSGRPCSAALKKKTLSLFFRSSRSLPLTLFC